MNRIRHLRTKRGWSQSELADRAGLRGGASISDLETGKGNPTLASLQAVAAALDVGLIDLLSPENTHEQVDVLTAIFNELPPEFQERLLEDARILRLAAGALEPDTEAQSGAKGTEPGQ
jgi:transcriptional regulator with XRE-family HTH domain